MSVLIGHASIDENGKIHSGAAGDQTKKEVCTRNWYNKSWDVVLRAKDPKVAEKMAIICEQACANNKIGYDQYQRNTLYTQAKKVDFNLSKITVGCECDCSSLMCICAIGAGVPEKYLYVGNNMKTTSTMRAAFNNSGMFEILTNSKYLTSDANLKRGDIIINEGSHTVMVLSNGSNIKEVSNITNSSQTGKGIGTAVSKTAMNVRTSSSTSGSILGTIPQGTRVEVLEITSNNWYKIVWTNSANGFAYVSNSGNKYFTYTSNSYIVQVTASALNVRKEPNAKSKINTVIYKNEQYTIVEEKNGWGKLKSGRGWINLKYTKKV